MSFTLFYLLLLSAATDVRPAMAEAGILRPAVGEAYGGGFGRHVDWLRLWRFSNRMRRRSRSSRAT